MEYKKYDIELTEAQKIRFKILKAQVSAEETKNMSEGEKLIDSKLDTLYRFYDRLPESVKSEQLMDELEDVCNEIYNALNIQLMQLAKSPYVKVEINEDNKAITVEQLDKMMDYFDKCMKTMSGFVQADCDATKFGMQKIENLLKQNGFKTMTYDESIKLTPKEEAK